MSSTLNLREEELQIIPVQEIAWLRFISAALPLKHRLFPLLKRYTGKDGLLRFPFTKQHDILFPSGWLTPYNSSIVFRGADAYRKMFNPVAKLLSTRTSGTIIDVGANFGEWVLLFRECSRLPIIAYEPSPFSFLVLQKMLAINGLTDVEPRNKACGDQAGEVMLDMGIVSFIHHSTASAQPLPAAPSAGYAPEIAKNFLQVPVRLTRLDQDLADVEDISLIKIDVEGYDYQVLEGALSLIKTKRPQLYLEMHAKDIEPHGHTLKDLCALAAQLNETHRLEYHFEGQIYTDEDMFLNAAKNASPSNQPLLFGYAR